MALGPVGVGAGQQQQHVGPGGERAPGLDPVEDPARRRPWWPGSITPATSEPKSGSVTATAPSTSAVASFGQPVLLLLLGAALDDGPGEDLGPGDQRAAGAQRSPGQLLGGDHHAQVVGVALGGEPAVLLGDRHAEAAHLGHALDDLLGDVGVGPVDVLGPGTDLLGGEPVEGVAHQLEVGVEVALALGLGQRGQEGRVAVGGDEGLGRRHPVGGHAPLGRRGRRCGRPARPGRRPRRRRRCGPRCRRGRRRRAPTRPCARRRRRGRRRRPGPGPRRGRRRRPGRRCRTSTTDRATAVASAAASRSGAGTVSVVTAQGYRPARDAGRPGAASGRVRPRAPGPPR